MFDCLQGLYTPVIVIHWDIESTMRDASKITKPLSSSPTTNCFPSLPYSLWSSCFLVNNLDLNTLKTICVIASSMICTTPSFWSMHVQETIKFFTTLSCHSCCCTSIGSYSPNVDHTSTLQYGPLDNSQAIEPLYTLLNMHNMIEQENPKVSFTPTMCKIPLDHFQNLSATPKATWNKKNLFCRGQYVSK